MNDIAGISLQNRSAEKVNYGAFMAAKRPTKTHIPKQIVDAIERVCPDGVVEIGYDLIENSYFHELYPRLRRNLSGIKGASLRYEREAREQQEENDWDSDDSNWSDNLPIDDRTYSYHLFFICPDDKLFRYETETEEPDEEDPDVEEVVAAKVSSATWSAFLFSLDSLSWS